MYSVGPVPPKCMKRRGKAWQAPKVKCSLQGSLHATRGLQLPTCRAAATHGVRPFGDAAEAAGELLVP